MEGYKVKIEIINEEGNAIGTITIGCETVKLLSELHGVSVLDKAYKELLDEVFPDKK